VSISTLVCSDVVVWCNSTIASVAKESSHAVYSTSGLKSSYIFVLGFFCLFSSVFLELHRS
jgi:hypothetical protein